jgi:hypothetical protein
MAGPQSQEYWMPNERSRAAASETTRLEQLRVRLRPLWNALLEHAIYREIKSLGPLRLFMEHHVFAVWDFMSLLKALQARLCCVSVPWLSSPHPQATRFINEIVLAEESDEDGQGGFLSHFGLYLRALTRCGTDTTTIDRFLEELIKGSPERGTGRSARAGDWTRGNRSPPLGRRGGKARRPALIRGED